MAAWLIARGSPAVRFLAAWITFHLLMVAAGIEMVSRHYYLAALPASLLASRALWWGTERAVAFLSRRSLLPPSGLSAEQAGFFLLLVPLTLLLTGSRTDLDAAAEVHREATAATRAVGDLVARRLTEDPDPRVVLVNMPAILVRDGMAAFTFGNGLPEQLRLVFDDRVRFPLLVHTYSTGVNGAFAGGSGEIPFSRLGSLIQEPRNLVLRFDFGSRRVVADERTARTIPRDYLRDTSPLLEWQEGQWPWLRVAAGSPLELPLAPPPEGAWIALRYLHGPETSFTVTEGAGATSALAIAANRRPADWPVALFPAPSASGAAEPLTLRLSPRSEVWLAGLWTFAPPRDYTPEAAPFLGWSFRPFAAFTLTDAIRLPLAAPSSSASPATIRLEVLAEPGRNFSLALEGGPRRASTSPPWPPGSGTRSTSRRLRASRRSSASSPRGRGQSS